MVDRRLEALLGGHLVVDLAVVLDVGVLARPARRVLRGHGLVGHRGGRRLATGGAERLVLEAGDLAGVGAVAPLELEMFLDRFVEQSHGAPNPSDGTPRLYSWGEASARTVRFLPARLAR